MSTAALGKRRRDALRALVRWPALASLAGLAAWRAGRKDPAAPLEAGVACIGRGLCRGCRALPGCPLPQARLARPVVLEGTVRPGEPRF